MMPDDRWRRLEELFAAARALPAGDRARFLAETCGDDEDLRAELESLLGYLPTLTLEEDSSATLEAAGGSEGPVPDRIAGYRILGILGSGGMGMVYLAEQRSPVARQVALKVIRPGRHGRQIVSRFEAERQAMALMDSPFIAQVLEAGQAGDGRLFFAMEHVKGSPLTEHCDDHRLDVRERLRLFIRVCEGVQHAHQKGIIHRDLKPSNVLVTFQSGGSIPKIIDFGLAKALGRRLIEETLNTDLGTPVGTLGYMSPEQASGSAEGVDTRTDIYSLGVILYELMAGVLPFDGAMLQECGIDEFRRRIREVDPVPPARRVGMLGDAAGKVALARGTTRRALAQALEGDIDCIVLKAMEKSRIRRYASASELAADVERHLANEPVLARPPGMIYRAGKFVRRHRAGSSAALLVVLALVAGIVGTSIGQSRALRAEARAREASEAVAAENDALKRVFEFLVLTLKGDRARAAELLQDCVARDDPGRREPKGDLAFCLTGIGWLTLEEGDAEGAERIIRRSLAAYARQAIPWLPGIAHDYDLLALALARQGRWDESTGSLEESVRIREALQGRNHPDIAPSIFHVALAHLEGGGLDSGLALLRRALDRGLPAGQVRSSPRILSMASRPETLPIAAAVETLLDSPPTAPPTPSAGR